MGGVCCWLLLHTRFLVGAYTHAATGFIGIYFVYIFHSHFVVTLCASDYLLARCIFFLTAHCVVFASQIRNYDVKPTHRWNRITLRTNWRSSAYRKRNGIFRPTRRDAAVAVHWKWIKEKESYLLLHIIINRPVTHSLIEFELVNDRLWIPSNKIAFVHCKEIEK